MGRRCARASWSCSRSIVRKVFVARFTGTSQESTDQVTNALMDRVELGVDLPTGVGTTVKIWAGTASGTGQDGDHEQESCALACGKPAQSSSSAAGRTSLRSTVHRLRSSDRGLRGRRGLCGTKRNWPCSSWTLRSSWRISRPERSGGRPLVLVEYGPSMSLAPFGDLGRRGVACG